MSLVGLIVLLVVVGVVLWVINTYVPMDAKIKNLLNIVVVAVLALWLVFKVLIPLVGDVKL